MEIPFEDVMGESDASVQSNTNEIDFSEASGQSTSTGLSSQPSKTKARFDRLFTPATDQDFESKPDDNFFTRTNKTLIRAFRSFNEAPDQTAEGAVKALASGAVSLGESAAAGLKGLAKVGGDIANTSEANRTFATQQLLMGELGFKELLFGGVETFTADMEQSQETIGKLREAAFKVAAINLAPENQQEKAMEDLLMLIPEGITAAGDNVYERTGSAVAGAGTQALLTLLTFKPSIASKTLKGLKSRPDVKASIEGLAKTDPSAAEALASHIEEASPRTAEVIRESIKTAKEISFEELGTVMAEADIAAKAAKAKGKPFVKPRVRIKPSEITPEEAGTGIAKAVKEIDFTGMGTAISDNLRNGLWDSLQKGSTRFAGIKDPVLVAAMPEFKAGRIKTRAEFDEFINRQQSKLKPQYSIDEDTGQHTITSDVGEFLAQENRSYLQVKRADVVEASQGRGYAQEAMSMLSEEAQKRSLTLASDFSVSPSAQRVYEGLQRKGFEVKENPSTVNPETGNKVSSDPRLPVYEVTSAPISEAVKANATQIFANGPTLATIPGAQIAKGKLTAWYDEVIRTINPEALGDKAKLSAAVTASKIAESMAKDAANHGYARQRIIFWEKSSPQAIRDFMKQYETGKINPDPILQKAADNIRQRNKDIYDADQRLGIKYDPVDNYLYHVFEDFLGVEQHFQRRYGAKWGDPKFTKDRSFELYEEAIKAGFKPKFTNPEEIMLARQHASDIAAMRVELLRDLEAQGLATEKTKTNPNPPKSGSYNYRRSPTGQGYWVESSADMILHNAFDTKSLWTMPGIRGDAFRGAMWLKNTIVPVKLALSLFHPLHVATIDNATGMVRASKSLLSGKSNPVKWVGEMVEAGLYGSKGIPFYGLWDNPSVGNRLLKVYQGKIDPTRITAADTLSLQYMAEGGMIPEMSVQFRNNAIEKFRKAINRRSVAAVWHLPFAAIEAMGKPMFQIWIPSLKIASYLKDVQTAIKTNPRLLTDRAERLLTFRRLAKSVDNRYGEMAYSTLFWNRTVKDLAVANTLSLGWNLGFLREYGGGGLDLGRAALKPGQIAEKLKTGQLDRPLFVAFYTTQSLLYGGLLTWAMTGQSPTELIDYIYPKSGDVDPTTGKDERLNTMFYPREFAAISKHIEHEGLGSGLGHLVSNKASGVIGLVSQWATGVNSFDQEIRDPNSPWHEQLNQTLAATLLELEPISVKSTRQGTSESKLKDAVLSVSGFSKAPRYATQTSTEASISTLYKKYYAPKQTPYETAILSNDRRELRRLYDKGEIEAYGEKLDEMQQKYDLTAKEQMKLAQTVLRNQTFNPYLSMFQRLTWQQQKRLLDKMSDDERAEYLPKANSQHLRYTYEAPEEENP